jgi:hypothetical protein
MLVEWCEEVFVLAFVGGVLGVMGAPALCGIVASRSMVPMDSFVIPIDIVAENHHNDDGGKRCIPPGGIGETWCWQL